MKQGEAKSRRAKMPSLAARLQHPLVTAPALPYLLRPCSRDADGLNLASPIPYPLFYTSFKVNGTAVKIFNKKKLRFSGLSAK